MSRSSKDSKNGKSTTKITTPIKNLEYGKIPPQAIDLEEAILGAGLIDRESLQVVVGILKPEDFYKDCNQELFAVIEEMYKNNKAIDILTVTQECHRQNILEEIGGPYYITQLSSKVATAAHIIDHALLVKDKSMMRNIIRVGSELQRAGFDETIDISDVVSNAIQELQDMTNIENLFAPSFRDIVKNTLEDAKGKQDGSIRTGLKTGYPGIDRLFHFAPGNIIFMSAIEKAGKTKMLINMLLSLLLNNNDIAICWYSMEDDRKKIVRSLISILTSIDDETQQSMHRKVDDKTMKEMVKATKAFEHFDIDIIDKPSTIGEIEGYFGRFCSQRPDKLCILAIDNFNISRDLERDFRSDLDRENYVCGKLQQLNRFNNVEGKESFILVLDHLSIKQFPDDAIRDGYRPKAKFVLGTSRKNQIVTQLFLFNRPGMYDDLLDEERNKPDIEINGKYLKRENVLKTLTIGQMVRNRNGTMDEKYAIVRFLAEYGTMDIAEWVNSSSPNIGDEFVERNIHKLSMEQFTKELWSINPQGASQSMTHSETKYAMSKEIAPGIKPSFDFLIHRYNEYYQNKLGLQADNAQFTAKENRIKSIYDWLRAGMYTQRFNKGSSVREISRDYYLYNLKS